MGEAELMALRSVCMIDGDDCGRRTVSDPGMWYQGREQMASEYETFLADLFAPLGGVSFRKMFGGLGIFKDGVMFALVENETLRMRVDDTTVERYRAAGSGPFVYEGKAKSVEMPYWAMPEDLFDDPDLFTEWAEEAFVTARRLKAAKPARSRRSAKKTGKAP